MTIPSEIRDLIKTDLWAQADKLDWANLSTGEKSKFYSQWTETSSIGGRLSAYMDPRQIRVYIKDTLLKSYTRERLANPDQIFRVAGVDLDTAIVEQYIKPHGRRLDDGRIIAWSRASEWKMTLLAVFERARVNSKYSAFAVVLLQSSPKFLTANTQSVVEDAARRLGVERLIWLD